MAFHQEYTNKNTSKKIMMGIAVWLPQILNALNGPQNLLLIKPVPDVVNFSFSA